MRAADAMTEVAVTSGTALATLGRAILTHRRNLARALQLPLPHPPE